MGKREQMEVLDMVQGRMLIEAAGEIFIFALEAFAHQYSEGRGNP